MKFRDFLDDLANDLLAPSFVRRLITTPNDEDSINDGSAIVIFSLVGSQWLHTVRIANQNKLFDELREKFT